MKRQIFTILSIEDNIPDFEIIKYALSCIDNIEIELINIKNGEDAINFIYKKEGYKSAPTPDLIMLDINLPSINGQDILEKFKNHDIYKVIPIIIFSSSESEQDIDISYRLHANSYVTKSLDFKTTVNRILSLIEFWLKNSTLPKTDNFCAIKKTRRK